MLSFLFLVIVLKSLYNHQSETAINKFMTSKDGALVRDLAFHQYSLGSIPA